METGYQRIFLMSALAIALCAGVAPPHASADEEVESEDIGLIRTIERRAVKLADIDSENFEVGIYGGLLAVEDFETNAMVVGSLIYHVTEDFFVEARAGASEAGLSSFERLSGGANLLPADDRKLLFYDLSLGANLFPGEAFFLDKWAVNSSFFLIAGVGATEFAGNQAFTVNAGLGYRMIANDFLSFSFQVRDRMFDTEITGERKLTHNFEISTGISIFF